MYNLKKAIFYFCIGAVLITIGVVIQDDLNILAKLFILGGLFSLLVGLGHLLLPLGAYFRKYFKRLSNNKKYNEAYNELRKLKKLLDEEIITQEEFETKAKELKEKVLCLNE